MHIVVRSRIHRIGETGIQQHVAMTQFGSLGLTRCTTGVEDNGCIIRARCNCFKCGRLVLHQHAQGLRPFDRGRSGGIGRISRHQEEMLTTVYFLEGGETMLSHRQIGRAFKAKIGFRISVMQVIGNFTRFEQDIEWQHHTPCFKNSIVHNRKVRDIWATQSNLVAFLDSCLGKAIRDLISCRIDLCI